MEFDLGMFVVFGSLLLFVRWMLPMVAVRLKLGTLLAGDTSTLAPAIANKIALITAPFVLQETLVIGSLTLASGNGLDPLSGIAGAQGVAQDPVSGAQILTLLPPTTGWRWVTSGTFTTGITIFGAALTDSTGATLLAVLQLAAPITVLEAGYQIELDPVQMTCVLQPVS